MTILILLSKDQTCLVQKNVLEEREAPWQTVLASGDPLFCTHLSTALWLELYSETSPVSELTPYLFAFSDDTEIPSCGKKSKSTVQKIYQEDIFKPDKFAGTGPLGSHSVRKMASSECRKKGASKDEKDLRGRWKSTARVSDVYDDIELPYPDTKVAARLCVGGPVKYQLRENSGITDNWMLETVIPNGRTMVDDAAAVIIGKALLWYSFVPEGHAGVPAALRARIRDAYALINNDFEAGTNPVRKIPVVVTGHDGEVYIDEIPDGGFENNGNTDNGGNHNGGNGNGGAFVDRTIRDQLLAMHSQLHGVCRSEGEICQMIQQMTVQSTRQYQTMKSNIRCIAPVL